MAADFGAVFADLKPVLAKYEKRMAVQADSAKEYTLVTKSPSPFPQHKGHGMFFASVKARKAYVSFHLMALYMNEKLTSTISAGLKKHMQGKSCFNFKTSPDAELAAELERLTAAGFKAYEDRNWL